MYAKWVENVNKNALVKFVPTEATRICSEHFRSDMKEEGGQKVILTPFAVPTIFTTSQVCVFVIFSLYNFFVFNSLTLTCFNVPRTSLLTLKLSVPIQGCESWGDGGGGRVLPPQFLEWGGRISYYPLHFLTFKAESLHEAKVIYRTMEHAVRFIVSPSAGSTETSVGVSSFVMRV